MPIYTVTFCTMDQDTGSNPFWHTCLLLSKLDEQTKKMEVVDNWGFYGLPTTSRNKLTPLKTKIGLDVDLYGNHGMLRHEDVRYLDLGRGLHGVTFELTKEKFEELQQRCVKMAEGQEQAINEYSKLLNFRAKTPQETRIYPFEHRSALIYGIELAKAEEEKRAPRLHQFKLDLSSTANTCKVQSLSLLDGILKPEQIARLSGGHHAISRTSGHMEKFYLHSRGPLRKHTKRSGETVFYRDGKDKDVKLYWTLPPQQIRYGDFSKEILDSFDVHADHREKVKKIVSQLQRLEWLFTNVPLDEEYALYRDKIISQIRERYEEFSKIEPKQASAYQERWTDSIYWLIGQPRDESEKTLMNKITRTEHYLQSLYQAVVTDAMIKDFSKVPNEKDIPLLAAYLTPDKQKELCKIIEKNYVKPKDCREQVCKLASQLHRIEFIFTKATLDEKYSGYRKQLLEQVKEYHDILPSLACFKDKEVIAGFKALEEDITDVNQFLHNLYMAVVDNWVEADLDEDLEGLAVYLPVDKKKDLCDAIGKKYLEPEPAYDLEALPGFFAGKQKPLCADEKFVLAPLDEKQPAPVQLSL